MSSDIRFQGLQITYFNLYYNTFATTYHLLRNPETEQSVHQESYKAFEGLVRV